MTKGFQDVYGIDYGETFAPVVKFISLRLSFALVVPYDLDLHLMDVKTAFLNEDLDEDIYGATKRL